MKTFVTAIGLVVACAAASLALAQQPGPAVREAPNGISYISGGAGEEERAAMAAQQGAFPLKIVLSGTGGEYVVARTMTFSNAAGVALSVADAGPVLMVKLPAGAYTVEATAKGITERRSVTVGSGVQTVNWRFPG